MCFSNRAALVDAAARFTVPRRILSDLPELVSPMLFARPLADRARSLA
jgi:hypothetical protein